MRKREIWGLGEEIPHKDQEILKVCLVKKGFCVLYTELKLENNSLLAMD